ncbi:hypothetical protein D3C73_1087440 [compost metagenome]
MATAPLPLGPICRIFFPRHSKISSSLDRTSAEPPIINTRVPSIAAGELPVTGASRNDAPRAATCSANCLTREGEIVLQSITVLAAPRPARTPSEPSYTALIELSSLTIVITVSATSAACLGVAAITAPCAASGPHLAAVRLYTVTS